MTSANAPATATEPAAVPTVAVESQPAAAQTQGFLLVTSGTCDAVELDHTVGPEAADESPLAAAQSQPTPMDFSFMGPAAAAARVNDEIPPSADQIIAPAEKPAAAAVNAADSQPPATTTTDLCRGGDLRVEGPAWPFLSLGCTSIGGSTILSDGLSESAPPTSAGFSLIDSNAAGFFSPL